MKTKLFIIISFALIAFASCKLDGSSNITPEIYINLSHINKPDTIDTYSTTEGGVFRMDTILTGDTVVMRMYLNGVTNNLTSFYLTQSDTSSTKVLLPVTTSLDSIFSKSQSDYEKGKFIFLPKETFIYFPIRYVAKKPSQTATIQFTLTSDANFENGIGSNIVIIKLKTPIIGPKP